ncbi:MAG: hypothetical protein V1676_06280 [Candidatus Diapherotrites archaeon]
MGAKQAIAELKKHANKECVAGMARFGIPSTYAGRATLSCTGTK